MALNPNFQNTRHSPQFFNTQVLGVTNPQHTPIIRNPYANKSTPNNSKDNNHTPNSDSTPYKNTGSRKLYTSPFLEESQKPPKDSLILNSEFEPLLPLISSQHEAFTQHIKDLSEISLTATKVIEKKNDSFLLLTDKKKTPRSLRIKCTLSTSPEFSTDNEFIQLKEELGDKFEGLPFGVIFSTFMVCCMAGSSMFSIAMETLTPEQLAVPVFAIAAFAFAMIMFAASATSTFLAMNLFEMCVGMYFPSMGTMKGMIVPEDKRAAIYNLFRIPLNFIVLFSLLTDLTPRVSFMLCGFMMVVATLLQIRLRTRRVGGKH